MRGIFQHATTPMQVVWRCQQIGWILSRSGVATALMSLGFEVGRRSLTWVRVGRFSPTTFDRVFAKNLAKTFMELGPTFIKLGQILATRPDLVSRSVADELHVLFDRVTPIPFTVIRKIVRRELGKEKLKQWVQSIDPVPLASASLSQTHKATLKDGTPVILKIQKRGVAKLIRLDLVILEGMARSASLLFPKLNLMQLYQEFREATLKEIDYREEAKNIERFHQNYNRLFSSSEVVFPRYFPDLTTQRVIALEPLHGKKATEIKKGTTVARNVASLSLTAILEQIFDHGFFHADPHAGNFFYLEEEGKIGFIDLGMVGKLEVDDKRRFLKVLLALLKRDRAKLAENLFELGVPSTRTRFKSFEADINELLDEVKNKGIDNLRMDQLISQLLDIASRNGIFIPNRYVMMIRSCLVIEGVAKSLDPGISIMKIATPIVAKSLLKTYSPIELFKRWF